MPVAPPPPDPVFSYNWGSFVIDRTRGAFGGASNHASQGEAQRQAIAMCIDNGGTAGGCRGGMTLTWQEGCAVIVAGKNALSMKADVLESVALSEALDECGAHAKDCQRIARACNDMIVTR